MAKFKDRLERVEKELGLQAASPPTQFDKDALQLYLMHSYVCGAVYPDWRQWMETPIAIRGRELHRQKYRPIVPLPGWSESTDASREFRHCFDREPIFGDLLRWEHVRTMRGPEMNEIEFGDMISAWERQIHHLPCPLKFENGSLFQRQRNGEWEEDVSVSWRVRWWGVECDVLGRPQDWVYGRTPSMWEEPDPNPLARMPSIPAVVFEGIAEGKHRCRPATTEERLRPDTHELTCALWCAEPDGPPPAGSICVCQKGTGFYGSIPLDDVTRMTEGPDAEFAVWDNPSLSEKNAGSLAGSTRPTSFRNQISRKQEE